MGRPKKNKPFRYLVRDKSRHGTVRLYYREPKGKRYRIEVGEDHPDFAAHYAAAKAGHPLPAPSAEPAPARVDEPSEGTFAALVKAYARSAAFKELRPQGQRARLAILEACCAQPMKNGKPLGTVPMDRFEERHVRFLQDGKAGLPGAANNRVKYLRILFTWAGLPVNPATRVKMLAARRKDGHKVWSQSEIARYEARHPVGTRARLALDLALYTAARRGDIVLFGPSNIVDRQGEAWIVFKQGKTGGEVQIPVLQGLARSIMATAGSSEAFLITHLGKPFTAAGLGNAFQEWRSQAGLGKGMALHGLRKAAASRFAELGASEEQIQAITGHSSSAQVKVYVKSANKAIMASSAMALLRNSIDSKPKLLEPPYE